MDKKPFRSALLAAMASRRLALAILIAGALCFAITTAAPQWWLQAINIVILALLALIQTACLCVRGQHFRAPLLLSHLGPLIILLGAGLDLFGTTATVNLYLDSPVDQVFRWDLDQEHALGAVLTVSNLTPSYYPVPVKIGVRENGRKAGLYITSSDARFTHGPLTIQTGPWPAGAAPLTLTVLDQNGVTMGTTTTDSNAQLTIGDRRYAFQLVAYQDPVLRQVAVDVTLVTTQGETVNGPLAINHPLLWQGRQLSLIQLAKDPAGRPYVGLQITERPGKWPIYLGCLLLLTGIGWQVMQTLRARGAATGTSCKGAARLRRPIRPGTR